MSWETFFDGFAPQYEAEPWTKNTTAEVDFLVEALAIEPGQRVLDMGCGTGRHAIELARRGFAVTGVDISAGMLAIARAAGADVEWVHADAAAYAPEQLFDAAICICEGAFGLLGDDADTHDLAILLNIRAALTIGGRLVLTAMQARKTRDTPFELDETLVERAYSPADLRDLIEAAGFDIEHLGGGTAGNWGRRPVEPSEIEAMAICVAQ